jgi:hypothetical protein
MRAALKLLIVVALPVAAASCNKSQHQPPQQQNNIAMEDDLMNGGTPENADVETLPADESSGTPSNELANGADNPDVNETMSNSD